MSGGDRILSSSSSSSSSLPSTPIHTVDPKTNTLTHPPTLLTPDVFVRTLRLLRRNGLISPLVSIAWNIRRKEIQISTQEGRVIRPLLVVENGLLRFSNRYHNDPTMRWTWGEWLSGRGRTQSATHPSRLYFHDLSLRYDDRKGEGWRVKVPAFATQPFATTLDHLDQVSGVMEYLDTGEIETRMLAMDPSALVDRETFLEHVQRSQQTTKQPSPLRYVHPSRHDTTTAYLHTDTPALRRARHALLDTVVAQAPPLEHKSNKSNKSKPTIHQRYSYTHCELHPALMWALWQCSSRSPNTVPPHETNTRVTSPSRHWACLCPISENGWTTPPILPLPSTPRLSRFSRQQQRTPQLRHECDCSDVLFRVQH